jgi:hypothetical protein
MTFATGVWSFELLERNATWLPWLRYTLLILAMVSAVGWLMPAHRGRRVVAALAISGLMSGLGGSAAYAVATASVAHTGSIPTVGSSSTAMAGGGLGSGLGSMPTGGGRGSSTSSTTSTGAASTASSSTALEALLTATTSRWSAAVVSDQSAASLELSTNTAVMSIGGWSGSDASISLAQFKADVAKGQISYFIASGQGAGGGMGGSTSSDASAITSWVEAHYTAKTVGGYTVYALTA